MQKLALKDIKALAKLWPFIKQEKKYLLFAIALIPFIAVSESSLALILRHCIDNGIVKNDSNVLINGVAIFFAVTFTSFALRALQAYSSSIAVHKMILNLRTKLLNHICSLNLKFHDKSLSGVLVTRVTSDFDSLSDSLNQGIISSVVDVTILIGTVVSIFYLDTGLALISICIIPIVIILVNYFSKALKKSMLNVRIKIAQLNSFSQESFYNHSTIKTLVAEKSAFAQNNEYGRLTRNSQMTSSTLDAAFFSVLDGLASIIIGLALYYAIGQIGLDKTISVGILIAYTHALQRMFEPLKFLGNKFAMLQGAFTSIERIFTILEKQDFIKGDKHLNKIDGKIEFQNVNYSYSKNGNQIINDLSFTLASGKSLAIVGATGSGKSTLIKLLSKQYDQYTGNIFIDNTNLQDIDPKYLNKHVAIVPQDIVLFEDTIAFNIAFTKDKTEFDNIIAAAKFSGAWDFIKDLPNQLDFKLAEQGKNLSQGQKQLISFSRALYKKPSIIILDEATSSIDTKSEQLIQHTTKKILQDKTTIIIAHRLSTIEQCDKIIVLDNGKIKESGTHIELLDNSSYYAKLYNS